jgi:hypothetical protein
VIRIMFLRYNRRFKDGKEYRYWSIVENRRCADGKVVQRQVLYLGEINDGQREACNVSVTSFTSPTRELCQRLGRETGTELHILVCSARTAGERFERLVRFRLKLEFAVRPSSDIPPKRRLSDIGR